MQLSNFHCLILFLKTFMSIFLSKNFLNCITEIKDRKHLDFLPNTKEIELI